MPLVHLSSAIFSRGVAMAAEDSGGVAVVVINYNAGPLLRMCLDSIDAQQLRPARKILIDNASSDESMKGVVQRHSDWQVLNNRTNVGFAAAANQGLALAKQQGLEFVAYLNPDARAEPDWLQALVDCARRHLRAASIASWMKLADREGMVDGLGDSYHLSGLAWRRHHRRILRASWLVEREVFGACGGAALFRVSALDSIGGFDESFFCYLEDVDVAYRLRLCGHVCVLAPMAEVSHVGSASSGYRSDFSVYHGARNLVWVYIKNTPTTLLVLTLPLHVFGQFLVWIVARLRGQGSVVSRAQRDALAGLRPRLMQRQRIQVQRTASAWQILRAMSKSVLFRS